MTGYILKTRMHTMQQGLRFENFIQGLSCFSVSLVVTSSSRPELQSSFRLGCLITSQSEKMNNLGEVCLVGLGVGGNYARYLVLSVGLGGAKSCGGGFKVIIFMGWTKGTSHKGNHFLWAGVHHEDCTHYVILLY